MRLNDWQLEFERYLFDASGGATPALQASLIGGPTLDVSNGLAIYHNAYLARLREVLREDFPAALYWLGDEEFDALADQYIRENPSSHFSLRWFGANFETFLRLHLVPEQSGPLAELVHFEWAFTLAFDAPPGVPVTLDYMATLAPEAWPHLQLELQPSVQWLECGFNSLSIWQAVKAEAEFPGSQLLESAQTCLIWRRDLICHYRSLDPDEEIALKGFAQDGWTFAEFCAQLADSYGEGAPLQAVTWLKQWIQDGLLQPSVP